jgi:hypothetical protein
VDLGGILVPRGVQCLAVTNSRPKKEAAVGQSALKETPHFGGSQQPMICDRHHRQPPHNVFRFGVFVFLLLTPSPHRRLSLKLSIVSLKQVKQGISFELSSV